MPNSMAGVNISLKEWKSNTMAVARKTYGANVRGIGLERHTMREETSETLGLGTYKTRGLKAKITDKACV